MMTENDVIVFIQSLAGCTGYGLTIGLSFGITILMLMSILDIFKVTTK